MVSKIKRMQELTGCVDMALPAFEDERSTADLDRLCTLFDRMMHEINKEPGSLNIIEGILIFRNETNTEVEIHIMFTSVHTRGIGEGILQNRLGLLFAAGNNGPIRVKDFENAVQIRVSEFGTDDVHRIIKECAAKQSVI